VVLVVALRLGHSKNTCDDDDDDDDDNDDDDSYSVFS